jgi:hypothetical protein
MQPGTKRGSGPVDLVDHATGGGAPQFSGTEFEFSRRLGADDVILEAECSTDLTLWQPVETHFTWLSEVQSGASSLVR